MLIIGITGTLGAGKGTVVDYLVEKKGFAHYSARTLITEEALRLGLPLNRDTLNVVANTLRKDHGPDFIARELFKQARASGKDAIIESIHTLGEIKALRSEGSFILLAVDAPIELRYQRIVKRGHFTDHVDFEKFQSDQGRELSSTDEHKQNLSGCIAQADFVINNAGSLANLEEQIDQMLSTLNL